MGETDHDPGELYAELETLLGRGAELDDKVRSVVHLLARAMVVAEEEVAVFLLDERQTGLPFLWPERLKQIGFIPYSSIDSLQHVRHVKRACF